MQEIDYDIIHTSGNTENSPSLVVICRDATKLLKSFLTKTSLFHLHSKLAFISASPFPCLSSTLLRLAYQVGELHRSAQGTKWVFCCKNSFFGKKE